MPTVVPVAVDERARVRRLRRPRDPEVGDLDAAVRADHQVLRLEVAVHDAVLLRRAEPGQQALEHAADLRERHPPDVRAQRAALDVLHRDVGRPVVLEVVEHRDHVRVDERARQPRLADEALGEARIRGGVERRELLQRDEPIEVELPREVDDRHPAATELADDAVAPDGPDDIRHFATLTAARGRGLDADRVPGGLELGERLEPRERVAVRRRARDALDGLGGELVDLLRALGVAGGVDDRVDVAVAAQRRRAAPRCGRTAG